MHKKIGEIVRNIAKHDIDEIVLDSNASAIKDQGGILTSPPPQLKIVCSIDSLNDEGYDFHAGVKGLRETSIENIKMVAGLGLLKRINMVVTKKNINDVPEMAEFCRELGVPLKLSDVGVRRNQIGKFEDIYVSLRDVKEALKDTRTRVEFDYSQNFGTPCDTFESDGQTIKIKDSSKGARYNFSEACGKCEFYPCSEGLYMITVMPDGTFSGCQSNGYNAKLSPAELLQACNPEPSPEIVQKITWIVERMSGVIEAATHIETDFARNLQMR